MSEPAKLLGYVELDVEYNDGRTETVKVRHIRRKHFEKYLAVFNNESAAVELFCDRESGWAETLAPASFDAIADKGQELNLPLFRNWYRRLMARSEAMNPGLVERANAAALENARSLQVAEPALSPSTNSVSPSPSDAD